MMRQPVSGSHSDRWCAGFLFHAIVSALVVLPVVAWADRGSDSQESFRQLQLGYVALDTGDFEAAVRHYSQARDLAHGEEQLFNALFGLGSAALELDRLDEARQALEAARELRPGEAEATFLLGVICRRQGDLERAVVYLAEAAAREPELTQALVELGIAYGALDRHADAERVCRQALAQDPQNVEAMLGLAVSLFHQDANEAAVEQFRRVLELDPDNIRAHYGLGLALVFADDRPGAMEQLRYLNEHAPELGDELYGWIFTDG
jgi:tetratricopeptide (TPR) repeat protein